MRKSFFIAAGVGVCSALLAISGTTAFADEPATEPTTAPATQNPTTQNVVECVSYGVGLNMGREIGGTMKQFDVEFDLEAIMQGLKDGLGGNAARYTDQELIAAFTAFESTLRNKESERNSGAGKAFLDANKAVAGVTTTESGLQYQIVEEGKGPTPRATDTVKVHYTGTFVDGATFDSSVQRGEPAEFPLDGVIKGWTEGFQLLKVGTKAKLFIPPDLAYGPNGRPPVIPPNSTLIFDVELLEIVQPATAPAEPAAPTAPNQIP